MIDVAVEGFDSAVVVLVSLLSDPPLSLPGFGVVCRAAVCRLYRIGPTLGSVGLLLFVDLSGLVVPVVRLLPCGRRVIVRVWLLV